MSACGGGGSGDAATAASAPAPVVAASAPAAAPPASAVPVPFVSGARSFVGFFGIGNQSIFELSKFTQDAKGAVTLINGYSLGAPATVRDVQGDASFAMGRWTAGPVSGGTSAETLTESSNAAYHYVLFNKPASLPASGSAKCDSGAFTTPTYTGGTDVSPSDFTGRVSGSAGVAFSAAGAAVTSTLNVGNAASTGVGNFSATVTPSVSTSLAGGLGTGGNSAFITIGTSGASYDVVGRYVVKLSSGANYAGVFRFRCV